MESTTGTKKPSKNVYICFVVFSPGNDSLCPKNFKETAIQTLFVLSKGGHRPKQTPRQKKYGLTKMLEFSKEVGS